MPFDEITYTADASALTADKSIMPFVMAFLPDEERGPAAAALLADCFTEALVARLFRIRPETLKKWRSDGLGPPRTTEGNCVLFPIPLFREYVLQRSRGAHESQRPARR